VAFNERNPLTTQQQKPVARSPADGKIENVAASVYLGLFMDDTVKHKLRLASQMYLSHSRLLYTPFAECFIINVPFTWVWNVKRNWKKGIW
jgi:hypothetical protein